VELWTEPVVEWRSGIDSASHHARLLTQAELLASWPPAPFEETANDCFRIGEEYWVWQPGIGGIRFFEDRPKLVAFPSAHVDSAWFEYLVTRSWLPAVYQIWGRQVLHASAVARSADGSAIAFAGPSCAGKSTMAYGLGRRPGWRLVSDDTLAFSSGAAAGAVEISVHRLRNDVRLRPASAEYFGRAAQPAASFDWLARPPRLTAVYFLDADPDLPCPARITALRAGESYALLLEQAHAVTLKLAKHNRQLMRDYLELAATIPVFRLTYRRSFEAFEEVVDALEDHLRSAETPGPQVEIANLLV
jgi:hypothetical protein